ncbi:MAG: phosphotransferase family protein [Acidobacteriota bacterium]|nr:phosphotransferase family protein [Acidobacteriota bacterium]
MELDELIPRLGAFAQAKYEDPAARVSDVHKMPGHAGFSYGFTVTSHDTRESWYLRLPPPNVRWVGTADVLRQVAALRALEGSSVPHCEVRWSGDDLEHFGRPYFVVPKLDGAVVGFAETSWVDGLDAETRASMARQAMIALAKIHRVNPGRAEYLGPPVPFVEDVKRWDRFMPKVADPERLRLVPEVRSLLLAGLPEGARVGIFHGDFQWSNVFYDPGGTLLAVIDWELTGIGATLNDVGWIATFNDPEAWSPEREPTGVMPLADELVELYREAWGEELRSLEWFRALAAYKFAIISGFNLGLHRRGRRPDPTWEQTALSIEPLLERARSLLSG